MDCQPACFSFSLSTLCCATLPKSVTAERTDEVAATRSGPLTGARRLAQDSWVDPFQQRFPARAGPQSLLKKWLGSKADAEVQASVEAGRKRLEIVSAAMAKRAKALGGMTPPSFDAGEDTNIIKAAALLATKLATGAEEGELRGGRFVDRETEAQDRRKKGGKLTPLEMARQKVKKDKEELYVEEILEDRDGSDGETDFIIIEDPTWEEGIVNEFIRQYARELQGDYEGLDDTMHFQIDRVESQIREYARAQADAVWKAWDVAVEQEKSKRGLTENSTLREPDA